MTERQSCLPSYVVPILRAGVGMSKTTPTNPPLSTSWRRVHAEPPRSFAISTSRSELDGQPIEGSNLSGSYVTSSSLGEPEQRLKRIRRVIRGTARKADGVEGSKDEVAQQASIRLRGQNACTLCIPDKLGPSGHIAAPQFARGGTCRITGKIGGKDGDRIVAQLVYRSGMRADRSTEPRGGIGLIGNSGQSRVEISERRQQPFFEHRLDQPVFRFEMEIDTAGL